MPTPNLQIEGGSFVDPTGNPLNLGYLVMTLSHDESYSSGPSQIVSGLKLRIALDSSGNIPASPPTFIYSSDVLTPSGSYYTVVGYKADGTQAFGPQAWQLTASPNPLNVGNIIPLSPPGGSVIFSGPLTLETNGVQNTNQNLLNLAAGAGITLSNSAGTTTISASGSGSSSIAHTASTATSLTQSTARVTAPLTVYPLSYSAGVLPSASLPAGVTLLAPAIGSAITISAYSITSNLATFTYTSTHPVTTNQTILLYGAGTATFFNQRIVTVRPGATSSTFTASFTHANSSNTENISGVTTQSSPTTAPAFSSWQIVNNNLYVYGPNGILNIGATVLLEGSAHASYLNGQRVKVAYSGAVTYGSYTHADAQGYYNPGAAFASDTLQVRVNGWEIISNTLYLYSIGGALQDGTVLTLQDFTGPGTFLNGTTVTANVSGKSPFFVAPFVHANDSATEALSAGQVIECSTANMGSVASSNVFSLGILQNYTVHAQLSQATSGRTWLGVGDARFLAIGNIISSSEFPLSSDVDELLYDTVPYSFVGFRYSPGSAGDTHFQCVTNNAGTQTTTDSGVAGDTAAHAFKITYTGSSIEFYIDGNLVATNTTNLPSTSLTLAPVEWVDNLDNCGNQLYCNVFNPNFTTSA